MILLVDIKELKVITVTVDASPAIEGLDELTKLLVELVDDGSQLAKEVIGKLSRTLTDGPRGVFECHFDSAVASGADNPAFTLHLRDEVRDIIPTVVRT
jgi:hypothetical protein